MSDKVLVSVNFSGSYLEEKIGHEFINLFPSDEKTWGFYIPRGGTTNKKYHELDYLLMVEHFHKRYSILGIATKLKSTKVFNSRKETLDKERRDNGKIKYFGKTLNDWFSKQEKNAEYLVARITYKQTDKTKVYFPTQQIRLMSDDKKGTNENVLYLQKGIKKRITGQSLHTFFNDENIGTQIDKLIKNGLLKDVTKDPVEKPSISKNTFLDVVGRLNDEDLISNWLNFYLQKNDFFTFFVKKICKLNVDGSQIKISQREKSTKESINKNRVDLYLETDNDIFIIENKVKSSIHASKGQNGLKSQLKVYSEYFNKEAITGKNLHCYLLCPDYYFSYYGVKEEDEWEEIQYSKLKECLDEFIKSKSKRKLKNYPFINEFAKSLEKHTKSMPYSMKDEILERIRRILDS